MYLICVQLLQVSPEPICDHANVNSLWDVKHTEKHPAYI